MSGFTDTANTPTDYKEPNIQFNLVLHVTVLIHTKQHVKIQSD